jgi:hypothetical protein
VRDVVGAADDQRLSTVPRYFHLSPELADRIDTLTVRAKARRRSETDAQRAQRRAAGSAGPMSGSKIVRALLAAKLQDLGCDEAVLDWLLQLDAEGLLL